MTKKGRSMAHKMPKSGEIQRCAVWRDTTERAQEGEEPVRCALHNGHMRDIFVQHHVAEDAGLRQLVNSGAHLARR